MIYKRFRLIVIIRILLLAFSIFTLFYLTDLGKYNISIIIIALLILLQVISLIRYVEHTNKKLTKFFESIRFSDFASSFSDNGMGKSFTELNKEFNHVIDEFKKNRTEKEEHFNYLQTVVQHISIGIIAYRHDGKVDIFNAAAKRLLRINNLRNIYELKRVKEDLPDLLLNIKVGDKNLVKLFIKDEILQISIHATEFRMRGEEYILISLQNIHAELEEKEIESWQKLIRVLTHEIMNSITPISSLASTVREMLLESYKDKIILKDNIDDESIEGIQSALNTIENRSNGLLNFVEIYRNLTRIPKPNFRYFPVIELFERAEELLKPKIEKFNISYSHKIFPKDLMLTADPDLIDQVIINLLLNAIDAVKNVKNPKISVIASSNISNRISIDFVDNGYGIKPDILDKIFMPFFTSKKEGSGIGLSLSRQIMHLHKGSIYVKSIPGKETVFTLTF